MSNTLQAKSHKVARSKINVDNVVTAVDDDEMRECWRVLPMGATSNTQFVRMGATIWSHATVTFDLGDVSSIVTSPNDDDYRKVFRSNADEMIATTIKEYYNDSEDDWPQQQQQILDSSSRFRQVFLLSDDFSNDSIARATFAVSRWWYPCKIENCYVRWWSSPVNDVLTRTVDNIASPSSPPPRHISLHRQQPQLLKLNIDMTNESNIDGFGGGVGGGGGGGGGGDNHCTDAECWFERFLFVAETCRHRRQKRIGNNICPRRRVMQLDRICCDSIVYFEETVTMTQLRACMSTNAQCLTELSKTISLLRLDTVRNDIVGNSAITEEYVIASRRVDTNTSTHRNHARVISQEQQRQSLLDKQIANNHGVVHNNENYDKHVLGDKHTSRLSLHSGLTRDLAIKTVNIVGAPQTCKITKRLDRVDDATQSIGAYRGEKQYNQHDDDHFERHIHSKHHNDKSSTTRKRRHNSKQIDEHSFAKRHRRNELRVDMDVDRDNESSTNERECTATARYRNDSEDTAHGYSNLSSREPIENELDDIAKPIDFRKRQPQGRVTDTVTHVGATDEQLLEHRQDRSHDHIASKERARRARQFETNDQYVDQMQHRRDRCGDRNVDSRIPYQRRRYLSPLERVLLTDEYTRVRQRTFMRYDDLYVRLNDVVRGLDERGRAEVSTIFRNTNRRYLVSLYEASRCSFRFFDAATNGARTTMLTYYDVLFHDRMLKCTRGPTARWLADRISEELFRVEFYRLYEYLRTAELFDHLVLVEEGFDDCTANAAASAEREEGDEKEGSAAQSSINDPSATTTAAAGASSKHRDDRWMNASYSSSNDSYATKLSNELRDIAHACADSERFSNVDGRRSSSPLEGIYLIRAIERCRRYARLSVANRRAIKFSSNNDSSHRNNSDTLIHQPQYLYLRASDVALAALVAVREASDERRSRKVNVVRRGSAVMVSLQSSLLDQIGIPREPWDLLIHNNYNDDMNEGTNVLMMSSSQQKLSDGQSLEQSEYFALYHALAMCDRAILRADDRFYANIFRTLHHRIARGLLLANAQRLDTLSR